MYACVCTCMYVYVWICMSTSMHVYIYMFVYVCTYSRMYTYVGMYVYVCMYVYLCSYRGTYTCISKRQREKISWHGSNTSLIKLKNTLGTIIRGLKNHSPDIWHPWRVVGLPSRDPQLPVAFRIWTTLTPFAVDISICKYPFLCHHIPKTRSVHIHKFP